MFTPHENRTELLGELHARPFVRVKTPQRVYHFGFLTTEKEAAADRKALEDLCKSHGFPPPAADAKYHRLTLPQWSLRWEQHSEFTSYTWMTDRNIDTPFFKGDLDEITGNAVLKQPGPLVVATHVWLTDQNPSDLSLSDLFVPTSICMFRTPNDEATVTGDFYPDTQGFTRFLICNAGLDETRAGVLLQRVLEVETYRTLALLGLSAVKIAAPAIRDIEAELAKLTQAISEDNDIETERGLLRKLTNMAARLEAVSAKTSWRFSASNAYFSIVKARLAAMQETAVEKNGPTFSAFFQRRLEPAMRTCESVSGRQNELSRKLMRTAELLRTRIQFELEGQNRNLLASMNRRARQQLRLQQTVEGLSVAAISYYVMGLLDYVIKGTDVEKFGISSSLLTALCVPLVVLFVLLIVRMLRKGYEREKEDT